MDTEKLKMILADHAAWVNGEGGSRADLSEADLRGADLSEADLSEANLRGADLSEANLRGADLSRANLSWADLSRANLSWADLSEANLRGAYLSRANLSWANLRGANLSEANLSEANLSWANLSEANLPAPSILLLASWGEVSEGLCTDLMRYDAACHHDPEAFTRWVAGGPCPYGEVKYQRAALFTEHRGLYTPGPCPRPWDLMVRLIREKCKDSDYHDH